MDVAKGEILCLFRSLKLNPCLPKYERCLKDHFSWKILLIQAYYLFEIRLVLLLTSNSIMIDDNYNFEQVVHEYLFNVLLNFINLIQKYYFLCAWGVSESAATMTFSVIVIMSANMGSVFHDRLT